MSCNWCWQQLVQRHFSWCLIQWFKCSRSEAGFFGKSVDILPSHPCMYPNSKIIQDSHVPLYHSLLFTVYSVEISNFFCHSNFTWNQSWRILSLKICHFNTSKESEVWLLWIFAPLDDSNLPNQQTSKPILQNWFHVKSE